MLEKLAKNILIKSNWISDYYYIVKVMQSCANKDSNLNPMFRYISLHRSYWWGDKQLKNKKNNLISKYPFLENQIEETFHLPFDTKISTDNQEYIHCTN